MSKKTINSEIDQVVLNIRAWWSKKHSTRKIGKGVK